jgi:hypothetical protein
MPTLPLSASLSGVSPCIPDFSSLWESSMGVVPLEAGCIFLPLHLRKKNQAKNATSAKNTTLPIVAPTMIGVFELDEEAAFTVPPAVGSGVAVVAGRV